MAKKKELSIEEKLNNALVPEEEWPYEVPENWCWTRLGEITQKIKRGKSPKYVEQSSILVFAQKCNQKDGTISLEKSLYLNEELLKKYKEEDYMFQEDIVINSTGTGTLGRVGYFDIILPKTIKGLVNDSHVTVVRPHEDIDNKFAYYHLKNMQGFLETKGEGSTNQKELKVATIENIYVPLPPLSEQKRIVSRIESLFAKLDEAKAKVQNVLDGAENRKSAMLHKAFTGELTKKWRRENGVEDEWEEKILQDVLDVRDGTHDSPIYYEQGKPLVTSKNLRNGVISLDNVKFISLDDFDAINLRSKVDIGDILFAMIGTIGNPIVVVDEPNYAIKNVALLKNINKIDAWFVKYYLESKYVIEKMLREAKGSTQKFVSLGYLRNFPISLPRQKEQKEIVRLLDAFFAKEKTILSAAEKTMERIDLMKKSILARAFRGMLGTNRKDEENATELLKEILKEK